MPDFLEERISGLVRMGASYVDEYAVDIVTTAGGQEFRTLVHPFPVRRFDVSYMLDAAATYAELQALYHRAHGRFSGFRARCADEWSSNGRVGVPTAFDQPCALVSAGVYQLRKYYGTDKAAGASGYAYREIKKPVAGSVLLGIGATAIRSADYTVNSATGRITLVANKTATITGISKAAQAVLSFASHPYIVGESIHISGVAGMTQINGLRALVVGTTSTTVTVGINSTAFGTWTSGGITNTRPQSGESVTAGFEFDFPVRFNTALPIGQDFVNMRPVDGVELIELLQP